MKQTLCLTTPKNKKGAYLSASSTVEASLVIPLFLYAALAVIYILQIISVKQKVQSALYADARKLAGYAYVYERQGGDYSGLNSIAAQGLLISELGSGYSKDNNIVGGNAGFIMLQSKVCNNNSVIDLKVTYTIRNPFDIFGIAKTTVSQRCKTDGWLGEEKDEFSKSCNKDKTDKVVYITPDGTVYHTNRDCTFLIRIITSYNKSDLISLTNYQGGHYYPCERCGRQNIKSNVIYVTGYGNRYHTYADCTQLMRTIISIPLSDVGNRGLCKKCGGGND